MKCIILLGLFVALSSLTIDTSSVAATSKPFVRSRYSKRWRMLLTTDSNVSNDTLTTEPQKAILAGLPVGGTTSVNNIAITRIDTTVGSSTVLPSTTYNIASYSIQKPGKGSQSTTTEHPRHPGPNGLPLDYDYYGNGGENDEDGAHK